MYDLCEEIGKEYIKEREYEVIRLMKLVGDISLIDSSENQKKKLMILNYKYQKKQNCRTNTRINT